MTDIASLSFELPLDVLERVPDHSSELFSGDLLRLGFNVAISPEFLSATLAANKAVIGGHIVVSCEGNRVGSAGEALEGDVDVV
nr:hypothetical protein [Paracoccus sulfuroxidans]